MRAAGETEQCPEEMILEDLEMTAEEAFEGDDRTSCVEWKRPSKQSQTSGGRAAKKPRSSRLKRDQVEELDKIFKRFYDVEGNERKPFRGPLKEEAMALMRKFKPDADVKKLDKSIRDQVKGYRGIEINPEFTNRGLIYKKKCRGAVLSLEEGNEPEPSRVLQAQRRED